MKADITDEYNIDTRLISKVLGHNTVQSTNVFSAKYVLGTDTPNFLTTKALCYTVCVTYIHIFLEISLYFFPMHIFVLLIIFVVVCANY